MNGKDEIERPNHDHSKSSRGIADTNELFLRSYQMTQMFEKKAIVSTTRLLPATRENDDTYGEMKVGKIAQLVLRPILESGSVPNEEIEKLQNKDYCKETLNIYYPLLVKTGSEYDKARYYSAPIIINGAEYVMCSQWFERPDYSVRTFLMQWIRAHS